MIQWRNVVHVYHVFGGPTNLLLSQKKSHHFLWRSLVGFWRRPWSFYTLIIFSASTERKIGRRIIVIHFCSQIPFIRNFGAPFSWRPPATPGQLGLHYAFDVIQPGTWRVARMRPFFYKPIWRLTVNERDHYTDSDF